MSDTCMIEASRFLLTWERTSWRWASSHQDPGPAPALCAPTTGGALTSLSAALVVLQGEASLGKPNPIFYLKIILEIKDTR
jgi:hypothetical protein